MIMLGYMSMLSQSYVMVVDYISFTRISIQVRRLRVKGVLFCSVKLKSESIRTFVCNIQKLFVNISLERQNWRVYILRILLWIWKSLWICLRNSWKNAKLAIFDDNNLPEATWVNHNNGSSVTCRKISLVCVLKMFGFLA